MDTSHHGPPSPPRADPALPPGAPSRRTATLMVLLCVPRSLPPACASTVWDCPVSQPLRLIRPAVPRPHPLPGHHLQEALPESPPPPQEARCPSPTQNFPNSPFYWEACDPPLRTQGLLERRDVTFHTRSCVFSALHPGGRMVSVGQKVAGLGQERKRAKQGHWPNRGWHNLPPLGAKDWVPPHAAARHSQSRPAVTVPRTPASPPDRELSRVGACVTHHRVFPQGCWGPGAGRSHVGAR